MNALVIWNAPLIKVGRVNGMFIMPPDDLNSFYFSEQIAFRRCANGVVRMHKAVDFWNRDAGFAIVLRPVRGLPERVWFYSSESLCRNVYEEWAGYGDPYGFDDSPHSYIWSHDGAALCG